MANVRYGRFIDDKIASDGYDWDMMLIGMHSNIRRQQRDMAKTSGNEYYRKDKDTITIIKNPTFGEKVIAGLIYLFKFNKKELVGYRKRCAVA